MINSILLQTVLPFILSALIVILITVIAEKFGTKIGGIVGTLPSTIVIAFLFISLNKGVDFAAISAAIVPAELGINILFLVVFSLAAFRSIYAAFLASFTIWTLLSSVFVIVDLTNIYLSLLIFISSLILSFLVLERLKQIPSIGKVHVHYTTKKILLRGILAGIIISIAVILSNYDAVLSGIFSVFPAILSSTMLISMREHGPKFTTGLAKTMSFGITSVCCYATTIHFLYPVYDILWGSIHAYFISLIFTLGLLRIRNKIL